jgi:hypothetical protein
LPTFLKSYVVDIDFCHTNVQKLFLSEQVVAVEMDIHGGKKVMETVILNLSELLMTQLFNWMAFPQKDMSNYREECRYFYDRFLNFFLHWLPFSLQTLKKE